MSKWRKRLHRLAWKAETHFDSLSEAMRNRLGLNGDAYVLLYNSYATSNQLFIKGRVLIDKGIKVHEKDALWANLLNTYKRIHSQEIPHAKVEITFDGQRFELQANEEGYIEGTFSLAKSPDFPPYTYPIEAQLLFPVSSPGINGKGNVFLAGNADFGVISDIDDTIMETGATSLIKMARLTFLQNVHNRIAFDGVGQWYQALKAGPKGNSNNPVFYVSSSPWNLYDLLTDFMKLNEIPAGPLFLRDYGIDETKLFTDSHGSHKRERIEQLLRDHSDLKFILIGDSGQQDAFIYYEVARDFPERILSVFIRDAKAPQTEAVVRNQIAKAQAEGIDMVWMEDTAKGVKHSLGKGYLRANKHIPD